MGHQPSSVTIFFLRLLSVLATAAGEACPLHASPAVSAWRKAFSSLVALTQRPRRFFDGKVLALD